MDDAGRGWAIRLGWRKASNSKYDWDECVEVALMARDGVAWI